MVNCNFILKCLRKNGELFKTKSYRQHVFYRAATCLPSCFLLKLGVLLGETRWNCVISSETRCFTCDLVTCKWQRFPLPLIILVFAVTLGIRLYSKIFDNFKNVLKLHYFFPRIPEVCQILGEFQELSVKPRFIYLFLRKLWSSFRTPVV